ncbi:F-box/kelch-repeat protein At3g23880-like [Papaver somniferum]|uniref:F-box/kelch-repeat protein At3g23880-like n=1 Tax=Papaver somniferum TaxID=3469 RepID=UPI000E7053F2|nr:F-box/kelch-repeat protein At3g23880-like [Papaver somniferum]
MSRLPGDIMVDILARLPVKSILRFKCVCKSWCQLFDDIKFCKRHYDAQKKSNNPIKILACKGNVLYSIDAYNSILSGAVEIGDYPFYNKNKYDKKYESALGIVGSCNGLVCIRPTLDLFCFWNPSTKQHKIVHKVQLLDENQTPLSWCMYGFGYDLKTQDYKLVRFESFYDITRATQTKVYSLASNSWSTALHNIPYTIPCRAEQRPLYFNGALHWLTDDSKVLLSFDLGDETIREVPGPLFNNNSYRKYVDVLGGCLCITCIIPRDRGDVWVMKEYGVTESWSKVFTIPQRAINFAHFRPMEYVRNREQILLSVRLKNTNISNVLVCYNPKRKRAEILKIHESTDPEWLFAYTYEESLFSARHKQNSGGILHFLEDDRVEQEEASHDHKRRKVAS